MDTGFNTGSTGYLGVSLIEVLAIRDCAEHALATARVATALHPVGALLLGVMGGPPAAAMAFALLHGAGNGMITIAKGTLPLALFGAVGYGLLQGWLGIASRTMQALAPYAFGLVLDGAGGQAALMDSGGLSLLALGALFMLKAPRGWRNWKTGVLRDNDGALRDSPSFQVQRMGPIYPGVASATRLS